MKAEHRKELQTNALAQQIARLVEGARSKPNTRTLLILGAVALVILLFFGWRYFSGKSTETVSQRWRQLYDATSVQAIDEVAEQAKGTDPGLVAELRLARIELKDGLSELGSPARHAAAVKKVEGAAAKYEQLAQQTRKLLPVQIQEALLNAGKAQESLGKLDSALGHYEKLAGTYPQSEAGKWAAERAKKIKEQREKLQDFYKDLQAETTQGK
jgi:tetratricopeptide (TPR) repeat protein